jgi:hypothetical protein
MFPVNVWKREKAVNKRQVTTDIAVVRLRGKTGSFQSIECPFPGKSNMHLMPPIDGSSGTRTLKVSIFYGIHHIQTTTNIPEADDPIFHSIFTNLIFIFLYFSFNFFFRF